MWMVVGLGNPGAKYQKNRHNIGFRVVDLLAAETGASWKANKGAEVCNATMLGTKVLFCKPMEFMNLSGFAVQKHSAFAHVPLERVLVVHDELDLPYGTIRLKAGGGHGGHNGLRSIIDQCGGNTYARVRVGIGKPPEPRMETAAWVLGDFGQNELGSLSEVLKQGADAVRLVVQVGIASAMNQINGRPPILA